MDENKEIEAQADQAAVADGAQSETAEGEGSEGETADENGKKEKKKKSLGQEILEWVEAIALAVIVALFIRGFIFTVVRVDGQSMDYTLAENDRLIVWRLGYTPTQGDVVIFTPDVPENENTNMFNQVYWVKRVIATGGQHVDIDYAANAIYVDGVKLDEPYLHEPMVSPGYVDYYSIDVPEGQVFLMGDNRNHSRDCREIGPADQDDVVGKAILRFWPLKSFGPVTHNN